MEQDDTHKENVSVAPKEIIFQLTNNLGIDKFSTNSMPGIDLTFCVRLFLPPLPFVKKYSRK